MKILCVGGSRFLGPVLVNRLLNLGSRITVVNRGNHPVTYDGPVQFIKADRNQSLPQLGFYDVVLDTCAYQARHLQHLLERVDFDFFIFISSVAAYQKGGQFPLTEDLSPLGDWPLWGDYNKGKVDCEMFLAQCGRRFASVRPVYILGPKNSHPRESFIYARLAKGQPLVLPGNGQAIVQFVFVDEVAELVTKLVEQRCSGAFNCVGDEAVTLQNLVEQMASLLGVKPELAFNPKADGANHRPEEFPFANESFFCSNFKAKGLGMEFRNLYCGLKRDFENYYRLQC